MAISGGDGSIILTTKVDQSGLNKGWITWCDPIIDSGVSGVKEVTWFVIMI